MIKKVTGKSDRVQKPDVLSRKFYELIQFKILSLQNFQARNHRK